MAILPTLEAADLRLRVISTPVKTIGDGMRTLIADMFVQMHDAAGIGLAGPRRCSRLGYARAGLKMAMVMNF
jgi:peptide deformylase